MWPVWCKLCWLHAVTFASTHRRAQECVFLYWKTFPCETFSCAQWSYREIYHLKKVQEVWLSHLWNIFLLLMNWDQVSMYSQIQFVRKFLNHFELCYSCMFLNTPFLHFHTLHTFTSLFYIMYLSLCKSFYLHFWLDNDRSSVEASRAVAVCFYFKLLSKTFTFKHLLFPTKKRKSSAR